MPEEENRRLPPGSKPAAPKDEQGEQNLEAGRGRRHVQWGPNEKRSQNKVHELDELAQDSGAFSSLRRSLIRHRDNQGRGPDTSPSHDLGVFIDSNETEGLPVLREGQGPPKDSPSRSKVGSWGTKSRNTSKKQSDDANATETSRRKSAQFNSFEIGSMQGTGILSELLAMYDRTRNRSSGASTPQSTDADTPTHPHQPNKIDRATQKLQKKLPKFDEHINVLDRMGGSDIPDEVQMGAGVFGPLVATIGNLSGIAAPKSAAVAPDVTRPGYHLSRYSMPDLPSSATKSESSSRPPSILESGSATPKETKKGHKNPDTPPAATSASTTVRSKGWAATLKAMTLVGGSRHTSPNTAETEGDGAQETRHRGQKRKREREGIYITTHVAHIIHRQDFLLKMARAFMMFGSPSHRLEAQLQTTARILGLNVSCMYLPGIVLISFNDSATGTSNIKFVKQGSALDLGKLVEANTLYWSVIHDELGVSDASNDLDELMLRRQIYKGWITVMIGGFCSAFICPIAFQGSFLDSSIAFCLGALLVFVQNLSVKNELYNNVFEIVIATLISFLAGALSSTGFFCYSAVASAAIVLILPGYIILCGALEVASRNITSGAVRMCYSVIYSLFLGFGLAMGAEVWRQVSGSAPLRNSDFQCAGTHRADGPWWQQTPSPYWAFLCTPMYALFLTLRNQAPFWKKELYVTWLFACAGWTANYFASQRFVNRKDIVSAIGAFVVGMAGNLYGRFFQGNAFVAMITGILFQLPTGLSNGGLLAFASQSTEGSTNTYASGFQVAEQLVGVAVGLTVGLFISAVCIHPIPSRRRGTALFSL